VEEKRRAAETTMLNAPTDDTQAADAPSSKRIPDDEPRERDARREHDHETDEEGDLD
jgi:hypothetical protein